MPPYGYKMDVAVENETGNLQDKGTTQGSSLSPRSPAGHIFSARPELTGSPHHTSTRTSRHGIIRPLAFLSFCRWGN